MKHSYFLILVVVSLLVLFSRLYILVARRYQIVDVPNNRSSHKQAIIRGGGILFPFGALLFFFNSGFLFPYFFAGLTILAIVSFIDDVKSLSVRQRIPVQFLAISLVLIDLQSTISLGAWGIFLFVALVPVGLVFVNCFNFIDGINGMLGLYGLSVLLPLTFLNSQELVVDTRFIWYIIAAHLVFGYYNFRKRALFFSGDVGSISMGLILFFLMVKFGIALQSPIILIFFMVFLTDTLGTVALRFFNGKSIFKASRDFMYERLVNELGQPHLRVSFWYAFVQLILAILALFLYKQSWVVQWIGLAATVLALAFLFVQLHRKVPKDSSAIA